MHLIWHIFKKDARLMRGPLAAWIGMFLMTFVVADVISSPASVEAAPVWNYWFMGLHVVFVTVLWLSAYFFAAIPVHEDSVAGGDAFWRTLPISRFQLLVAKLLGLVVLFGLVPLLLRLFWWWGHGFDLREIGLAAKESLQTSLAVVALAFTLASVTNNGPEFYRRTLGLIGVAIVAVLWLLFTRTGNFTADQLLGGGFADDSITLRFIAWRGLAGAAAFWLGLTAVGQFLAPNRNRTIVIAAIFMLAAVFFATFPVGTFISRRPVDLSVSAVATNGLVGKISLTEKSRPRSFVLLRKATLSAGPTAEWRIPIIPGRIESLQAEAEYFLRFSGEQGPDTAYTVFPEKRGLPTVIENLTFNGEGEIRQLEYVLSVPLEEGQEVTQGSRRLRIDRLVPGVAHGATIEAIRGRMVLTESLPVLAEDVNLRPELSSECYLLVTPSEIRRIFPDSIGTFVSSNVGVRTGIFPLGADQLGRRPDGGLGSLDSARLVKVGFRRVGWFQETIPVTPGTAKR
jgi:hypothetical protein